ncbi:uncharacterized protein LOC108738036 isoform X2 [Agrilus planipennis]|nr:uncharacterized protein LOC108738036 isoform X2 [Agrilus planipennis]
MANSSTSPQCSCNSTNKCKGRFGLAWVTTLPHDCCEPVEWHFEIMDSPSKVKKKFKEMANFISDHGHCQHQKFAESKKIANFSQNNFNCKWKEEKENKNRSFNADKLKDEKQECCSTTTSHTQTDSHQIEVNAECNTDNENNYSIFQGLQNYFLREILRECHDQVQDQKVLKYTRSKSIMRKVFENNGKKNRQILQRVTFNLNTGLQKNSYPEELSPENQTTAFPILHEKLSSDKKQEQCTLNKEQESIPAKNQIFTHEFSKQLCLSSKNYQQSVQKQVNGPTEKDHLDPYLSSQKEKEFCACHAEKTQESKELNISSKTQLPKKRRQPLSMETFTQNNMQSLPKNNEHIYSTKQISNILKIQVYSPPEVPMFTSKLKVSCSNDAFNSKIYNINNKSNSKINPCTSNNGKNNSHKIKRLFSIKEIACGPKVSTCGLNLLTSKSEVTETRTSRHKSEKENHILKCKASFVEVQGFSPSAEDACMVKTHDETKPNVCKSCQNVNLNCTKSVTCMTDDNKRNALKMQVFVPTSIYGSNKEIRSSNFKSSPFNDRVVKITEHNFVSKENWLTNNKIISSRVKTSIKEEISYNPEIEIIEPVKKMYTPNENYTKGQISSSTCFPEETMPKLSYDETKKKQVSKICGDTIMPPTIKNKTNVKYYTYNHSCSDGSVAFEKQYTQSSIYFRKSWMPVEILKNLLGKLEKKIASSFSMPQEVSKIYNPTPFSIINDGIRVKDVDPYQK